MEKICSRCKQEFPLENFYKDASRKDGLSNKCKSCTYVKQRKYKEKNPDIIKAEKRRYYERNKDKFQKRYQENKEHIARKAKESRTGKEGYIKTMLYSARARAKAKGWEFDLDMEFLMKQSGNYCPVDNLPFDWNRELDLDDSLPLTIPSLDRIDSSRGYTKDNVAIIGDKWNRWKSNMNIDDLELLVKYVRSVTKS